MRSTRPDEAVSELGSFGGQSGVQAKPGMINQYIFAALATLLFTQTGIAESAGTFTDPRDGQTYKTIRFKNPSTGTTVTWMAQNLNYKVPGSYTYDDKETNRKELGLLYTWEAATDGEWSMLVTHCGEKDKAGEALKSVSGWVEGGNGTNSSGFDALPAGIRRNNGYDVLSVMGFWWTSTPPALPLGRCNR